MHPNPLHFALIGAEGVIRIPAIIILLQRANALVNVLEDVSHRLNIVGHSDVPRLGATSRYIQAVASLSAYPTIFKNVAADYDPLPALELQDVLHYPFKT